MTINLPWFPNGDETSPSQVSLLHRYAGDYYQTYDLFISEESFNPRQTLFLKQGNLGPRILFPSSNRLGIERFFPRTFPSTSNWINKYYSWQLAWSKIELQDRNPEPIEIIFDWPLKFTDNLEVSYLTFDYAYNREVPNFSFQWYVRINETVTSEEWIPKYPPVFNSMQFSKPVSLGNAERLLSESEWILPLPSQDARQRKEIQQIKSTVESQVNIFYSIQNTGLFGCDLFNLTVTNETLGPYSNAQQAANVANSIPFTPGGCKINIVSVYNTFWRVLNNGQDNFIVFSGFGIDTPIQTYLTAGAAQADGWLTPSSPNTRVYFLKVIKEDYGEPKPCQIVVETSRTNPINNVQEDITYIDPEEKYICIVAANNNYWGFQTPIQDTGLKPKIFRADNATGIEFNLSLNVDSLRQPVYSLEFDESQSSFSENIQTSPFTFDRCFESRSVLRGIREETVEYQTQLSFTQSTTRVRTLLGFLSSLTFTELTNSDLIDSYYFANDGKELDVNMPDSIRIKEIHAAWKADQFATNRDGEERTSNLAWYLVSLCKFFGINYDKNGKNQFVDIRNAGGFTERRPITIIPGTSDQPYLDVPGILPFGCVGFTNDDLGTGQLSAVPPDSVNSYPQFVYKVKSNQFVETEFGSQEIQTGDYVVCYTFQQFMQTIMQDLDKAIGMSNAGANAIPNADGSEKICTYEGLGTLVAENAYMLSSISRQTSQTLVSSLIAQGIVIELLKATGYPLEFKEIKSKVSGFENITIPYPGLAPNSPSINSQVLDILNNLGPLVASILCPVEPTNNMQSTNNN